MTPTEIVEEIKRLPAEGKREVKFFLDDLEVDAPPVKYISDEDFKRATDEVFKKYDGLLRKLADS